MKKVVCISAAKQLPGNKPHIKVGNIYHVMEERTIPPNHYIKGILGVPGIYYNLLEIKGFIFHKSLFIEINDDQPDEVELIKEREQVV